MLSCFSVALPAAYRLGVNLYDAQPASEDIEEDPSAKARFEFLGL
jgi:hypothetical protein